MNAPVGMAVVVRYGSCDYCVHTADTDATQLDSCVASSSAVCLGINAESVKSCMRIPAGEDYIKMATSSVVLLLTVLTLSTIISLNLTAAAAAADGTNDGNTTTVVAGSFIEPQAEFLEKYTKFRLIFGLAEFMRRGQNSADLRLTHNNY